MAERPNAPRLPKALAPLEDKEALLRDEYGDPASITGAEICVSAVGCDLSKLELSGCLVRNCRFSGADMFGASFTDTVFEQCDFSNCVLRDAYFSRCEFLGCKLTGADPAGVVMKHTAFRDCMLRLANFSGMNADTAVFEGCDLSDAVFRECKLRRFEMSNCSLRGAVVFKTPLYGMDLTTCEIEGISVSESKSELCGAKISFIQAPVIARMLGMEVEY